jgi:tripartite-type tricarboxylate transporter receptor subunit TctC
MPDLNRRQLILAGAAGLVFRSSAKAANYPDRPIRVIIPYSAGGVGDAIMRFLSPRMENTLGQKLVIESKPGAAGNIGTLEVARATPDGYTLLVAAANNFVINQFLMKMPVDPLIALAPIGKLADVPLVLFSNPSVPARNLIEFIAYVRANPGKVSYGSPSNGTVNHLFIERLKQATGIDLTHVPYRGSPAAVLALLANEIQLFPVGLAAGAAHLLDGKLTALAAATEKRLPMLPQVPTVIESGFAAFTAANWWGMAAPKDTPVDIIERVRQALDEALSSPAVIDRFTAMGLLASRETREEFVASLHAQAVLWSEVIQRGNIAIE